jgi:hypothetical protein
MTMPNHEFKMIQSAIADAIWRETGKKTLITTLEAIMKAIQEQGMAIVRPDTEESPCTCFVCKRCSALTLNGQCAELLESLDRLEEPYSEPQK